METTLDLRPVCHRKDERIEAHVFLCFLALMLVRIAEKKTGLMRIQSIQKHPRNP